MNYVIEPKTLKPLQDWPRLSEADIFTTVTLGVGSFARECQVAHLAGRVIQHVYKPLADTAFQQNEAIQLEKTLLSFLPILIREELHFSTYCGALAICIRSVL